MKKLLLALPLVALAGCGVFDTGTIPATFVEGIKDGARWAFEALYTLFVGWWMGLF